MNTRDDLKMLQALPLDLKIQLSKQRIREWVKEFGEDGVYISFSGGKDSTVLLDLVRNECGYKKVPAVFVNTGLEYPEIQKFVRTFDNVTVLTPKMSFRDVISQYGYPFISKQVAHVVDGAQRGKDFGKFQLRGKSVFRGESTYCQTRFTKWLPLESVDFRIGDKCCQKMKKDTINYIKNGRVGITGQMAKESQFRMKNWLQHGCNMFDINTPISNPMSVWTEQDVLKYVKDKGLQIASVYGDVVTEDEGFEYDATIPGTPCRYKTTGCSRTGCIFCGFGAHLEKGEGRFERLKRTHPRQYEYCMGGGGYDADGYWKPTQEGLGMAHVIDELCRIYGPGFIKY